MTCASYDYVSELEDRIDELEEQVRWILNKFGKKKTYIVRGYEKNFIFDTREEAEEFLFKERRRKKPRAYTSHWNIKEEYLLNEVAS